MEEAKQCILVIIGAAPEGKKELLGFQSGLLDLLTADNEKGVLRGDYLP